LRAIEEAVANNDQIVSGFFRVYVDRVTEEERKYNEQMRERAAKDPENPFYKPISLLDKLMREAERGTKVDSFDNTVLPDHVFLGDLKKAFKNNYDKKKRVTEKAFESHGEQILLKEMGAEKVVVDRKVAYKGIRLRSPTEVEEIRRRNARPIFM
jgi:hypothetical protein